MSDPRSHDELLFIIIHQTYELWFKQILHEMDASIKWLDENRPFRANHSLRAVVGIEKVLVTQIHILETMAQIGFLEFRNKLNPASGFQSMQFRELEFVSGAKDENILKTFRLGRIRFSATDRKIQRADRRRRFLASVAKKRFSDGNRRRKSPVNRRNPDASGKIRRLFHHAGFAYRT